MSQEQEMWGDTDDVEMDEVGESTVKTYNNISKDGYEVIKELKQHIKKAGNKYSGNGLSPNRR